MAEIPSPEEMKKRREAAALYALMRDRPMSIADFAPEEEPPAAFASGSPSSPEGQRVYRAMEQGSLTPQGAPSATALMAEEALGGPVAQAAGKALKAAPLVGAAAEGLGSMAGRAKEMVKGALKGKADEVVEEAATAGVKKADKAADAAQEVVRVPEVRAPNEAQRKALQGTSLLDAKGQPRVLYHGTRQNFDEFDFSEGLGVHVGPAGAAVNRIGIKDAEDIYGARGRLSNLERKKAPARVIPMYVNLKRPLRLTEEATGRPGEGGWSAASVIDRVMKKAETEGVPGISEAEIDDWYDDALSFGDVVFTDYYVTERELNTAVKEWLKSKGYDGIVYNNAFEGGGDSYLLFDKSQIVPAQTTSK